MLGEFSATGGELGGHLYSEFWVLRQAELLQVHSPLHTTQVSDILRPQQRGAESQPPEDIGQPPAPSSPPAAPFPDTNTVIIVRDTEKHVS